MSRDKILLIVLVATACVAAAIYFPWDRPGRVQVSGTVFLDEKPLDVIRGSSVTFESIDGGDAATGVGLIESGGRYRIDTRHGATGILPGSYRIGVRAWKREAGWDDTKSGQPLPPEAVPKRYADVATSDLHVEVLPSSRQTIDIHLVSTDDRTSQPNR